jgi:predicted ATPase
VCLVYAVWSLWLRGYPDQALDHIHKALALTQQCSHSFCQVFALTFAVMLHWFRRDTDAVATQVGAGLSLAYAHAFPLFVAMGRVFQGGVLAAHRPEVESLEQIRQGMVAYQETGTELFRPYFLGLLAEAYGRSERAGNGLEALAEALALVELTVSASMRPSSIGSKANSCWWRPEPSWTSCDNAAERRAAVISPGQIRVLPSPP